MNLRETIKETTRKHLNAGDKLLGQCITAVGWVNGTVPNHDNIIELPCTDVSASHIVSGMALAGARPFLIIRFQDFLMLNSDGIVNFAAKQKDIFHQTCPIFVRALSQEGNGTGATHSAKLHSIFMHFPGVRVHSPITPQEWTQCYDTFMSNDDPMVCCEYKSTFDNEQEFCNTTRDDAEITLVGIGLARIPMMKVAQKIPADVFHVHQLKPLQISRGLIDSLKKTKRCMVIDCGFETCGAGSWVAYKLGELTGVFCHSIGLKDVSCAVAKERENATPNEEDIINKISLMKGCV